MILINCQLLQRVLVCVAISMASIEMAQALPSPKDRCTIRFTFERLMNAKIRCKSSDLDRSREEPINATICKQNKQVQGVSMQEKTNEQVISMLQSDDRELATQAVYEI